MSYEHELRLAIQAARKAGVYLKRSFGKEQVVLHQDARDVKLQADINAEKMIMDILDETGLPVLAEESGEHGTIGAQGPYWVVDPLDGTGNFNRGIPGCCVSIALCLDGEPVVGVVLDFLRDELFSGVVGEGASLNGESIAVSSVTEPREGILATGFPRNFDYSEPARNAMFEEMQRFMKVRMIGSSALAATYVACGRFDAYIEDRSMLWDFAGGLAIVRAAGGYTRFVRDEDIPWAYSVACTATENLGKALKI